MATGGYKMEVDYFTCSICLERLKSPKALPCVHTFCESCIDSHILTTERTMGHKITQYRCPVCRAAVTPKHPETDTRTWAADLPHNFAIASLMRTTKETGKQQCNSCERSKMRRSASTWCRECSEAYCNECLQYHKRLKASMNHNVTKIDNLHTDSNEMYLKSISDACPLHKSKVMEVFCFDHQELCCVLCAAFNHKKCENTRPIEDLHTDKSSYLENFNTIIKSIRSMLNNRLEEKKKMEDSFTNISKTTVNSVKYAKEQLDNLLGELLDQLTETQCLHETTLDDNINLITDIFNRMKDLGKVTSFIQAYGSATQLFIHLQRITNEIYPEILQLITRLRTVQDKETSVTPGFVLNKLQTLQVLGELTIKSKNDSVCVEECDQLSRFITLSQIQVRRKKTLFLPEYDLYLAICIDTSGEKVIAHVRNKQNEHKLIVISTVTSKIIAEIDLPKSCDPDDKHDEDIQALKKRVVPFESHNSVSFLDSVLRASINRNPVFTSVSRYLEPKEKLHNKESYTACGRCYPSGIAYDVKSKIIVVSCSCYGKHLYSSQIRENYGTVFASEKWNIHDLFTKYEKRGQDRYKGSLRTSSAYSPTQEKVYPERNSIQCITIHNKSLFVIVGNVLMKIDVNMRGKLQKLHNLGCDYSDIKKLAIDSLNGNCLMTRPKKGSIVCVSFDGRNSFSETFYSEIAAVAAKGLLVFVNETGLLSIKEIAGNHERILLEKCEKIQKIHDIWLDSTESILCILGKQHIELYDILFFPFKSM